MKEKSRGEIVIYRTKDGKAALEVNLSEETLWLNQGQMSILFERDRSVITKHLSNIFKSGELDKKAMCKKSTLLVPTNLGIESEGGNRYVLLHGKGNRCA